MSRDIKFRAWDLDHKEFVYISQTEDGEMWVNNGVSTTVMPYHKCELEQYTGLKDKNGEEIYEGDIVEYDWYIMSGKPAYRVKEQVIFDDMGARVGNDRIRNCSNVEVIGNIHENPELLEGEE